MNVVSTLAIAAALSITSCGTGGSDDLLGLNPIGDPPGLEPAAPPAVKPVMAPAVDPAAPPVVEPAAPPAVIPAAPPAVEPAMPPAVDPAAPPAVEPAMPPAVDPAAPPAVEPAMPPAVDPAAPPTVEPPTPPEPVVQDPFPRGERAPDGEMVVLYDGNGFDKWEGVRQSAVTWIENGAEGYMEVATGGGNHIKTKQEFWHEDAFLHLEFWSNNRPANNTAQARGNSGVYLQGLFELQILDSFGEPPTDTNCGAIYSVAAPAVNACKRAEEWNTYEIRFKAPRYSGNERRAQDRQSGAVISAWLNGMLIHDEQPVDAEATAAPLRGIAAGPGPLMLQEHSNAVRFRNVWLIHMND